MLKKNVIINIINVVIKPEFSKFPKKIKGMVAEFISM
jgi:hypothetical protein